MDGEGDFSKDLDAMLMAKDVADSLLTEEELGLLDQRDKFFQKEIKLLNYKFNGKVPSEQLWGLEQRAYIEIPGSLEAHIKWSKVYEQEISGNKGKLQ